MLNMFCSNADGACYDCKEYERCMNDANKFIETKKKWADPKHV